jgi:NAD(P)H dehydrogenase (quinone)
VLTAPLSDGGLAAVAREDLADVTARVLTEADADARTTQSGRHAGKTYELAGDTAIGGADLADIATKIAGNSVTYRPGALADLRGALVGTGMPGWQVDNIVSTYAVTAAGFLSNTDSVLADLLGTAPRPAHSVIRTASQDAT